MVDFPLLRQRIAKAARQTFDTVRAAHPGQRFYTFALYTVDDAVGVNASMNSEEAYSRVVERETANEAHRKWLVSHGISPEAALLGDHRWSPFDWEFDCAESEGFDAVNKLINDQGCGVYDHGGPLGFKGSKQA